MRTESYVARNIVMSERIYLMLEEDPSLGTTITLCEHSAPLEEAAELRAEERTVGYRLTGKQMAYREKLVGILLVTGKQMLQLKAATVELAVRLLDYYCRRMLEGATFDGRRVGRADKGRWVLERKLEGELVGAACLFAASKYEEIYPPALSDVVFVFGDKLRKEEIVRRENEVLQVTDFAFEISTISRWHEHLFHTPAPYWANQCYLKCFGSMEAVARVVHELTGTEKEKEGGIADCQSLVHRVMAILNYNSCRIDAHSK